MSLLLLARRLTLWMLPILASPCLWNANAQETPPSSEDRGARLELLARRETLSKSVESLLEARKLNEAIAATEVVLTLERQISGPESAVVADMTLRLVQHYLNASNPERAALLAKEVRTLYPKIYGEDAWQVKTISYVDDYVQSILKLEPETRNHVLAVRNKLFLLPNDRPPAESITLLTDLIKVEAAMLGPDHPSLANSRTRLAKIYGNARNFQEAARLADLAWSACLKSLGSSHPRTTDAAATLGASRFFEQNYEAAVAPLTASIVMSDNSGIAKSELANRSFRLAQALNALERNDAATAEYQRCLALAAETGNAQGQWQVLERLADLLWKQQQSEKALEAGEKAVALKRQHNKATATDLQLLADRYLRTKQPAKTIPHLQEILRITKADLGVDAWQTVQQRYEIERIQRLAALNPQDCDKLLTLWFQAEKSMSAGKSEQAVRHLTAALALEKELLGPNHPAVAQIHLAISKIAIASPNQAEARQHASSAAEIFKATYGPDHPFYASSLVTLAITFINSNEHKQVIPLLETALPVLRANLGVADEQYQAPLMLLSGAYAMSGTTQKSAALLRQAAQELKAAKDPPATLLIQVFDGLHPAEAALGNYTAAIEAAEQVIALKTKALGGSHPDTVTSVSDLAKYLHSLGNHGQATQLYQELAKLYERRQDFEKLAHVVRSQGEICEATGQFQAAEAHFQTSLQLLRDKVETRGPEFTESIRDLAKLYVTLGRYDAADALYRELRTHIKSTHGESSKQYAMLLEDWFNLLVHPGFLWVEA